ncbi:MAG: hypothetical protein FD134_1036 [Gallionellaceae bacterium]|nr:MAG: hypothetical protein FD134_1036 [Gallionellaceae bacterium]
MALIITDECINCDVCEPECPKKTPHTRKAKSSCRRNMKS